MTIDPRTVIREKVAESIWRARHPDASTPWELIPQGPGSIRDAYRRLAEAAIAAHLEALEQANTIRTVEELDALPVGTVIRWRDGGSIDLREEGGWLWGPSAQEELLEAGARVLWRPEEA